MANMSNNQPADGLAFLPKRQVVARTSLSTATIDRKVARGEFPRPVKLSHNRCAWVLREIDAWMAARLQERDMEAA